MPISLTQARKELLYVDLTDKPAQAKIVREGYQVPAPKVDQARADFVLESLLPIAPKSLPRVISQSIKPGTKVTKGTVVDLILVPKSSIPFDMFEAVHADLVGKKVDTLTDTLLEDPKTRQILLNHENAADISSTDKEFLTTEFGKNGVNVDSADANRTFEKAYTGARNALAFR